MKLIIGPAVVLLFLTAAAYGQTGTRNLKHLTKAQYILQLQLCADSAYADMGMPNATASYDGTTYDWVVGAIDEAVKKHFKDKISLDANRPGDITYKVVQSRNKRVLSFALVFVAAGKEASPLYFLSGTMTEKGVQGIIKLHNCRKEIKPLLAGI